MTGIDLDTIRATFRTLDPEKYPELLGMTRDEIYAGKMGPGGLYLAAAMVRTVAPRAGMRILDIGCGRGATSRFLARRFQAQVFAVDLWISASENHQRFVSQGFERDIVPLHLDVEKDLPFPADYFDLVFCMDCVHYFGGASGFWARTLAHLKPGGDLAIGSPCFTGEFTAGQLDDLPQPYDDGTPVWAREFSQYHSPGWWAEVIGAADLMEPVDARIADDGEAYWEDEVLYNIEHQQSKKAVLRDARQIRCRREGYPYLTHFLVNGQRRR